MERLLADALTPPDRRRALRTGAAVVAVVALLDGALLLSPRRAAVWVAWAALLALAGEAIVRVPPAAVRGVGVVAAVLSTAALATLVLASGGSASPLFAILPMLPALGAIIAPDDDETLTVLALAVPLAGVALLAVEGRSPAWIALWAAPVVLTAGLVVRFSREHRRRRAVAARAAQERAAALDRLARSERELARVERLARLPLLADGVAHDLNSPLSVVSSTISLARIELRDGKHPELEEALADAAESVSAMKRIVGDLQRLAGLELEHAGVPARATELALREAVQYVAALLAEGAAVRAEIPDGLPVPVAPRHAVVDLLVQMVRALACVGTGEITVRAERAADGLTLSAGRSVPSLEESAALHADPHLSMCRAYVEGLGGRFRSSWDAGTLRLAVALPVLPD
jgi:signal transduction histidine kinase